MLQILQVLQPDPNYFHTWTTPSKGCQSELDESGGKDFDGSPNVYPSRRRNRREDGFDALASGRVTEFGD